MKLLVYLIVLSVGRYECNEINKEENLPTLCHGKYLVHDNHRMFLILTKYSQSVGHVQSAST